MSNQREIDKALRPPTVRAGRRSNDDYVVWLDRRPDDEALLAAAFLHLDDMADLYWARNGGKTSHETEAEFRQRAVRVAETWRDLRWDNRQLKDFLSMTPAGRATMARPFAIARARNENEDPLLDDEVYLYYH